MAGILIYILLAFAILNHQVSGVKNVLGSQRYNSVEANPTISQNAKKVETFLDSYTKYEDIISFAETNGDTKLCDKLMERIQTYKKEILDILDTYITAQQPQNSKYLIKTKLHSLFDEKPNPHAHLHLLHAIKRPILKPLINLIYLQIMLPKRKAMDLFNTFFSYNEKPCWGNWLHIWKSSLENLEQNISPETEIPTVNDDFLQVVLYQLLLYYQAPNYLNYGSIIMMLQKILSENTERFEIICHRLGGPTLADIFREISEGSNLNVLNTGIDQKDLRFVKILKQLSTEFKLFAPKICLKAHWKFCQFNNGKDFEEPIFQYLDTMELLNSDKYYKYKAYLWKRANLGSCNTDTQNHQVFGSQLKYLLNQENRIFKFATMIEILEKIEGLRLSMKMKYYVFSGTFTFNFCNSLVDLIFNPHPLPDFTSGIIHLIFTRHIDAEFSKYFFRLFLENQNQPEFANTLISLILDKWIEPLLAKNFIRLISEKRIDTVFATKITDLIIARLIDDKIASSITKLYAEQSIDSDLFKTLIKSVEKYKLSRKIVQYLIEIFKFESASFKIHKLLINDLLYGNLPFELYNNVFDLIFSRKISFDFSNSLVESILRKFYPLSYFKRIVDIILSEKTTIGFCEHLNDLVLSRNLDIKFLNRLSILIFSETLTYNFYDRLIFLINKDKITIDFGNRLINMILGDYMSIDFFNLLSDLIMEKKVTAQFCTGIINSILSEHLHIESVFGMMRLISKGDMDPKKANDMILLGLEPHIIRSIEKANDYNLLHNCQDKEGKQSVN